MNYMIQIPVKGDIVLSRGQSIVSDLICWYTNSEWSHAGILISHDEFIDAMAFKGVRIGYLSQLDNYEIYRVSSLTAADRNKIVKLCYEKLGMPYDFIQAALLFWRILIDALYEYKDDPYPEKYICSEFVAEIFATVGITFGKYVDNVLPKHIAQSPVTQRLC